MKNNNLKIDFKVYDKRNIKRTADIKDFEHFDLKYAIETDDEVSDKINPVLPIFQHRFIKDIFFNKIMYSENSYHEGEPFCILSCYAVKKKELNSDGTNKYTNWVEIMFLDTYVIVKVPYFNRDSIYRAYNPYHPMYGGFCSLGNIDILDHEEMFNVWTEVIRRIFDISYDLYKYFGKMGAVLRIPQFACFEDFIKINEEFKKYGIRPMTDPNDSKFYLAIRYCGDIFSRYNTFETIDDITVLSRMPYSTAIPKQYIIPNTMKRLDLPERDIDLSPKKTGRPKGVLNKTHKLYRLVKDKPQNQLYRLINKY